MKYQPMRYFYIGNPRVDAPKKEGTKTITLEWYNAYDLLHERLSQIPVLKGVHVAVGVRGYCQDDLVNSNVEGMNCKLFIFNQVPEKARYEDVVYTASASVFVSNGGIQTVHCSANPIYFETPIPLRSKTYISVETNFDEIGVGTVGEDEIYFFGNILYDYATVKSQELRDWLLAELMEVRGQ